MAIEIVQWTQLVALLLTVSVSVSALPGVGAVRHGFFEPRPTVCAMEEREEKKRRERTRNARPRRLLRAVRRCSAKMLSYVSRPRFLSFRTPHALGVRLNN